MLANVTVPLPALLSNEVAAPSVTGPVNVCALLVVIEPSLTAISPPVRSSVAMPLSVAPVASVIVPVPALTVRFSPAPATAVLIWTGAPPPPEESSNSVWPAPAVAVPASVMPPGAVRVIPLAAISGPLATSVLPAEMSIAPVVADTAPTVRAVPSLTNVKLPCALPAMCDRAFACDSVTLPPGALTDRLGA